MTVLDAFDPSALRQGACGPRPTMRAILHRSGKLIDLALAVDEARRSKFASAEPSGEPVADCRHDRCPVRTMMAPHR
jgi:hypothetical protein